MRALTARRGITLIELLVVIAIFIALAAMVAAAAPRFGERQAPSRGASQLQSWLNLARQMAIRDQRPRGVRILVPNGGAPIEANYCRELQYIEQPESFNGASGELVSEISGPAKLSNGSVMPVGYGGSTPPDYTWLKINVAPRYQMGTEVPPDVIPFLPTAPNSVIRDLQAPVQIGDVLHIYENVSVGPRRIVDVYHGGVETNQQGKPARIYYVKVDKPLDDAAAMTAPNWFDAPPPTQSFTIHRQARPMAGEPVLQLPRDVGIDFSRDPNPSPANSLNYTWYRFYPKLPTGGGNWIDIMFHPDGHVFGSEWASTGRIILWVRDVSQNPADPTQMPPGDNTLITIYTRTGNIAAHPVDPSGLEYERPSTAAQEWNPFRFTQDSRSSGM